MLQKVMQCWDDKQNGRANSSTFQGLFKKPSEWYWVEAWRNIAILMPEVHLKDSFGTKCHIENAHIK